MSFAKGICPVCSTPASAKCRICGLESSPFEAAVRLGGGELLVASEATRRVASKDPLVGESLEEVRWICRMRAWGAAVIQAVEMALRKQRPDAKNPSDDERRWLSQAAKNPLIVDHIALLTVEGVDAIAAQLETASARYGAKKVRRPLLGDPEQPIAEDRDRENAVEPKDAPSPDAMDAYLKTPEGQDYLARHFANRNENRSENRSEVAAPAPADEAKVSRFTPPYHLGG